MGFADSQATLQASTANTAGIFGDDDEPDPDEKPKKKKGFDFLQWLFGWILDPITAIIEGIINLVKFVINAIKFCINLNWCIKWYIFYMIGTILYLPLALLFMFFGLQKIEKKIWKAKKQLHDLIVCYTGYSIIGYSDEIRDGCFFETIKPRKCPAANMPNIGLSDILAEFMKGMFSFTYIGVVTALSFFFFFIWFIYYFLKPFMVQFYSFIMSSTKSKMETAKNAFSEGKKNISETATKFEKQVSDTAKNVSNTAENLSKTMVENQKAASSGFINQLNPPSLFPKKVEPTTLASNIL